MGQRATGCFDWSPVGSICRHLLSCDHNGVEIQASCPMIVCMLILIFTGGKPDRAMYQMVWYYRVLPASLRGTAGRTC
ncbi:MAG: hypothetical protein FJ286_10695 [Planctomycetes bacterium]|nr:hypothetical protein [Planctomycetota bacterium]